MTNRKDLKATKTEVTKFRPAEDCRAAVSVERSEDLGSGLIGAARGWRLPRCRWRTWTYGRNGRNGYSFGGITKMMPLTIR